MSHWPTLDRALTDPTDPTDPRPQTKPRPTGREMTFQKIVFACTLELKAGGKPSTWFPPAEIVELLKIGIRFFSQMIIKIKFFYYVKKKKF